jgi:hypothetical protein
VLYVPMIDRLRRDLGASGILYVGDSKMSALGTRGHIQRTSNRYLVPLASVGEVPRQMAEWIQAAVEGRAKTVELRGKPEANGEPGEVIGRAYEMTREVREDQSEQGIWNERVMIVQSEGYAEAARKGLRGRIERATKELLALTPKPVSGRRVMSEPGVLERAANAVIEKHDVAVETQRLQLSTNHSVRQHLADQITSASDFCARVTPILETAVFEQKRRLVELLVDQVIVTGDEIEIRYVIPLSSQSEAIRFCHLRKDYRAAVFGGEETVKEDGGAVPQRRQLYAAVLRGDSQPQISKRQNVSVRIGVSAFTHLLTNDQPVLTCGKFSVHPE